MSIIKESTLKKWGKKLKKMDFNIHIPLCKFKFGCKKKGIEIAEDKDYFYVKDDIDLQKIADLVNNKTWIQKIARHRIKEDCEGCKYLDEEKHLGKSWCKKWDTDIWNVASIFPEDKHVVNKACVPFRYFGYTPNLPPIEKQTGQYSLQHFGMKNEKVVKAFVEANNLNELGKYHTDNDNVFIGEFDGDNSFGIRYNPELNKIQMKIEASIGNIEKRYEPVYSSLKQMQSDWKEVWLGNKLNKKSMEDSPKCPKCKSKEIAFLNVAKEGDPEYLCLDCGYEFKHEDLKEPTMELIPRKQVSSEIPNASVHKKAYDPKSNAPRQERNFDWINSEEYKKKHNPQETKQYDISPSNVGDNKNYDPETYNSFGKSDADVGRLI